MAIRDWNEKLEVLKSLLNEETKKGVLYRAQEDIADTRRYIAFLNASKQWGSSKPGATYMQELRNLCRLAFGACEPEDVKAFIETSFEQFVARAEQSRDTTGREQLADQSQWFKDHVHTLTALDQDRPISVKDSVRSKRLDQRLYYTNVDSASVWNDLINDDRYPLYDWCRESLRNLLRSDEWRSRISANPFGAVVMLGGGGAASKDIEIISALAKSEDRRREPERIRYVLVDISPHMLSSSIVKIKKFCLNHPDLCELITIEAVVADILSINELKKKVRVKSSSNAWFLTGGTIGNFNETKLLMSIESVAEPGDLLAIGIDTYDKTDYENECAAISAKYNEASMLEFLATPIGILLHSLNHRTDFAETYNSIRTVVVNGRKSGYSDIDESISAELSIFVKTQKANGREPEAEKYTLVTSNRYDVDAFVAWFADRGWHNIGVYSPSDQSASFRQILFERQ